MRCIRNRSPRPAEQSDAGRRVGSRIVTSKWPGASDHSDCAIFVLSKSAYTLPWFLPLARPDWFFLLCKFLDLLLMYITGWFQLFVLFVDVNMWFYENLRGPVRATFA